MSCSQTSTIPDKSDSSDYGSDFTPDDEQILSELLAQAVADHASAVDATASSAHPPVTENATNTAAAAELFDLNSLNPAAVADIEDGLESPPGVRLPKVLGRERESHSPWRQSNQPFRSSQTSQGPNNRDSPFGETGTSPASVSLI
jgi:exonuclease V